MTAVLSNGNGLHAPDDYSQPVSQASSPASPSASFIIQQTHLPSINLSAPVYGDRLSQPGTPTSIHSNASIDPPQGVSFTEYLRMWKDDHVNVWLSSIKCGHLSPIFRANDIRGDVLLELDQMTLKEMGVLSVGDRVRIVAGVKKLRQRCLSSSNALSTITNRSLGGEHSRSGSQGGGDNGSYSSTVSRNGVRRLDNARPAPLHLTPGVGTDGLPRLVRDGQDSARSHAPPPIRPLPQPNQNSSSSSSTPTIHTPGSRPSLPSIPPVPRSQPPPVPNARPSRSHLVPPSQLSGRRTPTLPDPTIFNTNQPLPPAPNANLLTPTHDTRAAPNGARPIRSPSPLHNSQLPNRNITRSPNEHGRNASLSVSSSTGKSPSRPIPGNSSHPYALQASASQQTALSPIAEGFNNSLRNASGTPSPPTAGGSSYRGFTRPGTPSHAPSLDDIRRKVVKFSMPDEGKSSMIQVLDCSGGAEILERALKKLRGFDDGPTNVEVIDGGLVVDGWAAFLDDSQRSPLTEAQIMSICQAPPDDPAREHGLTLRQLDRNRRLRLSPTSPHLTAFPRASGSTETLSESLLTPEEHASPTPGTKAYKRASSISILSGLGVQIPDAPSSSSISPTQESPSKSPGRKGKLRNFFGQRPPSELITTHLAEYFPFTEKKVLERTRRQSMMRSSSGMGLVGRRDSIVSWNPPPRMQSRFSSSTQGSQTAAGSPRNSIASRNSISGSYHTRPSIPTFEESVAPPTPPRVSVSTEDGRFFDATQDAEEIESRASRRISRPHLLPPVAFPSESLAESLNLVGSRPDSIMSNASKRFSLITELRSKRDRSDTASMLTVDEITAEVESRRESIDIKDFEEADGWTAVDSSEADTGSIKEVPEDEYEEEEEEEEEEDEYEEEEDDDADDTVIDEDEPGKAITSHGEKTIKWIKGALIGAGSFGKVYLGMDASTGLLMAVKQVELPTGSAPNEERKKSMLSALEREIELLKDLHHENIVQYHSSSAEDDYLNIFLEYVPGGSVTSLLRNYGAFEEPLVRNWVRQILLGLNYLHERDIIHRDIKGANMLVDNKGGIKISDFGISKKVEDNLMAPGNRAHRPSLQGSVFWMAPEVVKQTAYTQKADIWSVGCLVVEMLTGEHPYPQLSQMQAIFKIGMSSKPTIPADISSDAENFLQRTFELNHEARPSAAELLKHPWIANLPPPLGA